MIERSTLRTPIIVALRRHLAWLLVTLVFVLFRLPPLLNPGIINSDGAVTALQARQILRGEWAWLHWGRDYLTSIDSVMAAPLFALAGGTATTMMLMTLLGQITSMWFAYAMLRKRLDPWTAAVAVLPMVFMTMAVNIYLFFDIRQWCLALVMCSLWILDGASDSAWSWRRYALGVLAGVGATFVDLFAVQFLPGVLLFAVLCCFDGSRRVRVWAPRLAVVVISTAASFGIVRALEHVANVSTNRASWDLARIPSNFRLLVDTCLPWLIGSKIFALGPHPYPDLYSTGALHSLLQTVGAVVFGAVLLFGPAAIFIRRIPWKVRRLGVVGSGIACTSLAGFLVSAVAVDLWAGRLLSPVVLALPLAIAPLGFLLRGRRLTLALSPYLLCIAIGGWLSYGELVDGIVPRRTARGVAAEEQQVAKMLRDRGISYAAAHYWLAYRLALLFDERPIVVPLDSEDRYPRYRREYDAAPTVAYLFHPSQAWLSPEQYESSLAQSHTPFEKIKMFDFTILIVHRTH